MVDIKKVVVDSPEDTDPPEYELIAHYPLDGNGNDRLGGSEIESLVYQTLNGKTGTTSNFSIPIEDGERIGITCEVIRNGTASIIISSLPPSSSSRNFIITTTPSTYELRINNEMGIPGFDRNTGSLSESSYMIGFAWGGERLILSLHESNNKTIITNDVEPTFSHFNLFRLAMTAVQTPIVGVPPAITHNGTDVFSYSGDTISRNPFSTVLGGFSFIDSNILLQGGDFIAMTSIGGLDFLFLKSNGNLSRGTYIIPTQEQIDNNAEIVITDTFLTQLIPQFGGVNSLTTYSAMTINNGMLYLADATNSKIHRFDATTYAFIDSIDIPKLIMSLASRGNRIYGISGDEDGYTIYGFDKNVKVLYVRTQAVSNGFGNYSLVVNDESIIVISQRFANFASQYNSSLFNYTGELTSIGNSISFNVGGNIIRNLKIFRPMHDVSGFDSGDFLEKQLPISESKHRTEQISRRYLENISVSESTPRMLGLIRTILNRMNLSEVSLQLTDIGYVISENLSLSESFRKIQSISRRIQNALGLSEQQKSREVILRGIVNALSISESHVKFLALLRTTGDSLHLSETQKFMNSLFAIIRDSLSVSEQQVSKSLVIFREQLDRLTLSESQLKIQELRRQITNNLSISERPRTVFGLFFSNVDRLIVSETRNLLTGLFRHISDSLSVSESISRRELLFRMVRDNLSISESRSKGLQLIRTIANSMRVSESIGKMRGLCYFVGDNLRISESISNMRNLLHDVIDYLNISESLSRRMMLARTNVENMVISETNKAITIARIVAKLYINAATLGKEFILGSATRIRGKLGNV